ncbi:helix-turn-helix domain-containing protein [Latilactobacillus sakei]
MEYLLEAEDYQSLLLFAYIESSPTNVVSVKMIEDKFDLTYFKVNRLMGDLIQDLEKLNLDQYFYIEKENGEYHYRKNGLDSINRLLWVYCRRSLSFSLIDYMLKHQGATIEEFSDAAYISLTKAYKVRKAVRTFFKAYQIKGFDTKNAHDEFRLRLVLTQLYYHAFKDYELPFEPVKVQRADYLVKLIEEQAIIATMTDAKRVFLTFYCLIASTRLHQGFEFKVEPTWQAKIDEYRLQIKQVQAQWPKEMLPISTDEIGYVLQLLDILGWEKESHQKINLLPEDFKKRVLTILQSSFRNHHEPVQLNLSDSPILSKLWKLCQRYYYDDNIVLDGFFSTNLSVFEENYYELYQGCLRFIDTLEAEQLLKKVKNHKTFIMELVMIALNNLDFKALSPRITVTVNFSLGMPYNRFIESNLRSLPFNNIQINNQYSAETDIYLSDVLSRHVKSDYVIWNSPPNAIDWEVFGNLVARIKEDKQCD